MTATNQQNSKQQNNTISDYDRALSALQAIPADYQRAEWVGLLGAAKAAGLDDSDIEQWSASSDKYDPRNFKSTIKKISETGGATEASLYWHAMQNGWIDPRKQEGYTPPSPEETERQRIEREEKKAASEAATKAREKAEGIQAARWANALRKASQPASPAHPYLQRKGIAPTATLRQIDASEAAAILGYAPSAGGKQLAGTLLLAVGKRTTGGLCTAELIDADGRKTAIKGAGTRTGAYWATGKPEAAAAILIAEGIATAISARDGSVLGLGDDVVGVATFSNGNLPDVAAAMRQQYPQAKIVLCADVDKATGTVPDKYAVEAAQLVGGYLAVPAFGADRPEGAKDFNDLHQLHGLAAVKACIDAAQLIEPEPAQAEADEGSHVVITSFADIKPEAIDWLWYGWLARGKFHLLAGAPGQGKTTIAMAMAATVSMGGKWADGSKCEAGRVLIWSGEDDPADTLAPRLLAAGANVQRCSYLTGKRSKDGQAQPFDPAHDMPQLEAALRKMGGVDLLVIDPVVSAITGDSHKNAEVRRGLQPVLDLAAAQKCAVLGITHFSKGGQGADPTQRVIGSVAFSAVARVVLVAAKAKDKEGKEVRILARSKANIADDSGGFEYYLEQTTIEGGIEASRIAWGQAVEGSARELLTDPDAPEDEGATDVVNLLRDTLSADEWTECSLIFKTLAAQGFSKKQAWTASRKLQICKKNVGFGADKKGYWKLPHTSAKPPAIDSNLSIDSNDSTFQNMESMESMGNLGGNGIYGAPDFDQPADPVQPCNLHTNSLETLKTSPAIVTNSPVGDGAEMEQTSPINPDIAAPDYVEITI